MGEQEPRKETIGRGQLFYLWHPGTEDTFSGYGLALGPNRLDYLVGLLMVDRPQPADPTWLAQIEATFGECQLTPMTAAGERGLACQMQVKPGSLSHLRQFPSAKSTAIQQVLEPLLDHPPKPVLRLRWNEKTGLWQSRLAVPNELPAELREVFERTGYGCLAAETNIGVVHICHASDADIEGFAQVPVRSQWQLILMPSAPLIRLTLVIQDNPIHPFQFESFLNVADEDQLAILARLAGQDQLYLAFYGDGLDYRFTKAIGHDQQQWQQLDEITAQALAYWDSLPPGHGDFDRAKAAFMRRFI